MRARGPYSLAAAARFVEGFPAGQGGGSEPRMDLAFPADGSGTTVGVRVTEDSDGLRAEVVLPAFPAPDRLAELPPTRGLTIQKVDQLRELGRAAAAGRLDADLLRGMPPPMTRWSTSASSPVSARSRPSSSCCAAPATRTPSPRRRSGCTARWRPRTTSVPIRLWTR
jgi:hypothetical protein